MRKFETFPAQLLTTLVLYGIAAWFGYYFSGSQRQLVIAWPPSGVAIASMVIFGPRIWPAITLASLAANTVIGVPPTVALLATIGNTLAPLVGWYLLNRVGFVRSLERVRDVVTLIVLGAFFGTILNASFGTFGLWLANYSIRGTLFDAWLDWWQGNMVGVLVVAPFLMTRIHPLPTAFPRRGQLETALLMLLVLGASLFIFMQAGPTFTNSKPRSFFIFPVLLVVAIRLGFRGLTASILVVAATVTWSTTHGFGRFWTGDIDTSMVDAQLALVVLIVSNLVLAATVAERQRERLNLQASNAQRQAILNAAGDSIVTMDHLGRVIEFNVAAEKAFGYRRSEVLGVELASLIIPQRFRAQHRKGLARYLVTGQGPVLDHKVELPALRADGSEFPVEISIVPLNKSGPPEFTGFIEDVTERNKLNAEREFAEQSQKVLAEATAILSRSIDYRTTLRHIAEVCIPRIADFCIVQIVQDSGKVETTEIATSNLEQESLLRDTAKLYLSDPKTPTLSASIIHSGQSLLIPDFSETVYRRIASDDELISRVMRMGIRSFVGTPIHHQGKVIGALLAGSVIPSRRYGKYELRIFEELADRAGFAIENARLYSEAREAVQTRDEFLSIASHELRTPLTSLSLQLQVFTRELKKGKSPEPGFVTVPVRAIEIAAKCQAQGEKLRVLLDDLLDITRIRLGRLKLVKEPVELSSVVREAVDRFKLEAAQKGSSITIENLSSVTGNWDQMRIDQVVTNLISNAVKYGCGKPIVVSLKQSDISGRAVITVRDHGIGISPEMKDRVFERFERADVESRKIPGLGLGLYISRQIVEAHGGLIRVESEEGKGSTFIVEIPLSGGEGVGEAKAV